MEAAAAAAARPPARPPSDPAAIMLALISRLLDWFRSLFWKEEMELTLVGLQYSGKTTFVNVIAVRTARSPPGLWLRLRPEGRVGAAWARRGPGVGVGAAVPGPPRRPGFGVSRVSVAEGWRGGRRPEGYAHVVVSFPGLCRRRGRGSGRANWGLSRF